MVRPPYTYNQPMLDLLDKYKSRDRRAIYILLWWAERARTMRKRQFIASSVRLGDLVGISQSTAWRRIDELVKGGYLCCVDKSRLLPSGERTANTYELGPKLPTRGRQTWYSAEKVEQRFELLRHPVLREIPEITARLAATASKRATEDAKVRDRMSAWALSQLLLRCEPPMEGFRRPRRIRKLARTAERGLANLRIRRGTRRPSLMESVRLRIAARRRLQERTPP